MKPKLNLLQSQSTFKYELMKDEKNKLYYIKRVRDGKLALLGDREISLEFILFGIDANKDELGALSFI